MLDDISCRGTSCERVCACSARTNRGGQRVATYLGIHGLNDQARIQFDCLGDGPAAAVAVEVVVRVPGKWAGYRGSVELWVRGNFLEAEVEVVRDGVLRVLRVLRQNLTELVQPKGERLTVTY